ncbi:hypothetical protein C8Q70DRAFT_1015704 [Cubamyces menziesii]|nr:hypothetical protein C8Q70DRAFT_1015704 [Cubamyces menziesii]
MADEPITADTLLQVPRWLQTHPELLRRGIVLTDCLKPSYVYSTTWMEQPGYAVKILDSDNEEAAICERLNRESDPRNHTVPCEIIGPDAEGRSVLSMPCLSPVYNVGWSTSKLLSMFLQILEGVEYMHSLKIAHLDLSIDNIIWATEREAKAHSHVLADRLYIIDFHTSRQLTSGPGYQRSIVLPRAQIRHPPKMETLDPYSWDVYCLGKVLELLAQTVYWKRKRLPWIVCQLIGWLTAQERGCAGPCHCRPTARRARQVVSSVQWVVYVFELCAR